MRILAGGEYEGPSNLIMSLVMKYSPFYPYMTEALRFHELQELKLKILQLLFGRFMSPWDHLVSVGYSHRGHFSVYTEFSLPVLLYNLLKYHKNGLTTSFDSADRS